MAYEKSLELKIIRTKHKITFNNKTTAISLTNYLNNVPPDAEVDECYENEENGEYVLIFHSEERDNGFKI